MAIEIGDELKKKIKKGQENIEGLDSLLKELNEYGIEVPGYVSKVNIIKNYKETLEDLEKSPKIYVNSRIKEEVLKKAKNSNLSDLTINGIEYRFEKFSETSTQKEAREFIQVLNKEINQSIESLQTVPSKPLEKEKKYKSIFNAVNRIYERGEKATLNLIWEELKNQGVKLDREDVSINVDYCRDKGILDSKRTEEGRSYYFPKAQEKSTINHKDVAFAIKKIHSEGGNPTKSNIAQKLRYYGLTFENKNLRSRIGFLKSKKIIVSKKVGNEVTYIPTDVDKQEKIEGKKAFIVPEKKSKGGEYEIDSLLEKAHESVLQAGMYYNGEIKLWKALSQRGLENVYKTLWDKFGIKGMKEEYRKKRPYLAKKVKIPEKKLPEYVEKAVTDLYKRQEHPTGAAVTAKLSEIGIVDIKDVNRILYNDHKAGKYRQEKTSDRKTVYLPVKKPEEKISEKKAPEISLEEKTVLSEFPDNLFLNVKKDKLIISESGHFIPKKDMDKIIEETNRSGISCLSFDMMTTYGIPSERKYDVGTLVSKDYIMKELGEDFESVVTQKRITFRKKPKGNKDAK